MKVRIINPCPNFLLKSTIEPTREREKLARKVRSGCSKIFGKLDLSLFCLPKIRKPKSSNHRWRGRNRLDMQPQMIRGIIMEWVKLMRNPGQDYRQGPKAFFRQILSKIRPRYPVNLLIYYLCWTFSLVTVSLITLTWSPVSCIPNKKNYN